MTLIRDNRAALAGQRGLHVFVAGVGGYPHLAGFNPQAAVAPAPHTYNMGQLSSTMPILYKMLEWLLAPAGPHGGPLDVPLATCRVLLSPRPGTALPGYVGPGGQPIDRCTRANFVSEARQWRSDAAANPNDVTLFYFAGHGLQRSRSDSVLLMEDFGAPDAGGTLHNTISVRNLYKGMCNPIALPNYAKTQLFFVDACRVSPSDIGGYELMNVPDLWNVELGGEDQRSAPIFYATRTGTAAAGVPDKGTIFGQALLRCLDTEAADLDDQHGDWRISVMSLIAALQPVIDDLNETYGGDQQVVVDGTSGSTTLRVLAEAPIVPIRLELVPGAAVHCAAVSIWDELGNIALPLPRPLPDNPHSATLRGGYYKAVAEISPPEAPYRTASKFVRVRPPFSEIPLKVGP